MLPLVHLSRHHHPCFQSLHLILLQSPGFYPFDPPVPRAQFVSPKDYLVPASCQLLPQLFCHFLLEFSIVMIEPICELFVQKLGDLSHVVVCIEPEDSEVLSVALFVRGCREYEISACHGEEGGEYAVVLVDGMQ